MRFVKQNKDVSPLYGRFKRMLVCLTLVSFLSGCIMVPKTHEFQEPRCKLITKELTVTVKDLDLSNIQHANVNPVGLLGLPFAFAFLFTASVVVSGSIVVAGNSIHWIEQEGTCDDGKIRNAISDLSDSLSSMGGKVMSTSKELMDWLMFWKEKEEAKAVEEQDLQEEQEQDLQEEQEVLLLDPELLGSEFLDPELVDNELESEEMLETSNTPLGNTKGDLPEANRDN